MEGTTGQVAYRVVLHIRRTRRQVSGATFMTIQHMREWRQPDGSMCLPLQRVLDLFALVYNKLFLVATNYYYLLLTTNSPYALVYGDSSQGFT